MSAEQYDINRFSFSSDLAIHGHTGLATDNLDRDMSRLSL